MANAGFEKAPARGGQIPDWAVTAHKGVSIQLDKTQKHGGRQSVRIASTGPVACLGSRPLAVPNTGRLAISVWLRTTDAARQPPLRLALEGKLYGRDYDYYSFASVGLATGNGEPAKPIFPEWGQYVVQVNNLPLEGLTDIRVRFDLMGPGEVWVDDVQVFCLAFNRAEMVELSKIITLADVKLQNGQIGDCVHLLEGYWPQFLDENVPLPPDAELPSDGRSEAAARRRATAGSQRSVESHQRHPARVSAAVAGRCGGSCTAALGCGSATAAPTTLPTWVTGLPGTRILLELFGFTAYGRKCLPHKDLCGQPKRSADETPRLC